MKNKKTLNLIKRDLVTNIDDYMFVGFNNYILIDLNILINIENCSFNTNNHVEKLRSDKFKIDLSFAVYERLHSYINKENEIIKKINFEQYKNENAKLINKLSKDYNLKNIIKYDDINLRQMFLLYNKSKINFLYFENSLDYIYKKSLYDISIGKNTSFDNKINHMEKLKDAFVTKKTKILLYFFISFCFYLKKIAI